MGKFTMPPSEPFSLPHQAYGHQAIQEFQKQIQIRLDRIAQAQGKSAPQIPLEDIVVDPGEPGDGHYELVYRNKELDALLVGQVSTMNQEMRLVNQRISDPDKFYIFHYTPLHEACSLTTAVLGPTELEGMHCKDGWLDPKLEKIQDQFESISVFNKFCQNSFKKFLDQHPEYKNSYDFTLARTIVDNQVKGDKTFNLLYHDPTNDFFCRAEISTTGDQIMVMGAGMLKDGGKNVTMLGDPEGHEMTDACRLTEALVGIEENQGQCHEFTSGERHGVSTVDYTWKGLMLGLGLYEGAGILTWASDKIFKHGYYEKSFGKWGDPVRWMGRQLARPFRLVGNRLGWNASETRLACTKNLGKAFGNALIAGWVYDKATGLYLSPDHPARKYGTYGAAGLGAVSPYIWERVAATQAMKAFSTRLLSTRILGGALSRLGQARLGTRLLAVMALNFGIRYLVVDGEYDAGVNKRVTDEIYDKYVYGNNLYNPIALLRAGSRFLAPEAMEWAVSKDNGDIKSRILKGDREDSEKATVGYGELLAQLLEDSTFFDPMDPQSFTNMDISQLKDAVTLNEQEEELKNYLTKDTDLDAFQKDHEYSDTQMTQMVHRVVRFQLQNMASFLVTVDQPLNHWARRVFNEDGTVKEGMEPVLLAKLYPETEPQNSPLQEMLLKRRMDVALHHLMGHREYQGNAMDEVVKNADLIDEQGQIKMDAANLGALTIYASKVLQNPTPEDIARLNSLFDSLNLRYSTSQGTERQLVGQALEILGIDLKTQTHKSYRPGQSPIDQIFSGSNGVAKPQPDG